MICGYLDSSAPPASLTWDPADKSTDTTLSGADLIATVGPWTLGGTAYAAVRVTSSKTTGIWQVDFTIGSAAADLFALIGITAVAESVNFWPGISGQNGLGWYFSDGEIQENGSAVTSGTSPGVVSTTYSLVYNAATGYMAIYSAAGTLLVSYTRGALAGVAAKVHYGNASQAGTRVCTLIPVPANLRGGASAWSV